MNRRTYKARVTTSFALAHLAKEVVDEDWSAPTAAFRLRVLVGENVAVLHRIRARLRRVATRAQDEPIRRALAILDVAVGKPNEVMPKLEIWSGLKAFLEASESTNLRDGVVSNISNDGLT